MEKHYACSRFGSMGGAFVSFKALGDKFHQ